MKIAVIGAGVAGLGAAWLLSRRHDVVVYERESRFGGHSCTVDAPTPSGRQPVDVGFIVFNEPNYPNLVALFEHLGVPTEPSNMSFAVSLDEGRFEYGSSSAGYFAQRSNLVRPSFLRMTHDILRFNRLAPRLLQRCEDLDFTIGDFLDHAGLGSAFRDRYLVPMAACIWSTPLGSHARLPGPDLRALLPQSRAADRRAAACLAHGERRQPVLRRAHRRTPAPARAAGHPGQRDPSRDRRRPGARCNRPLGPLRQGDHGLPCRPGARPADRRRRLRTRLARPLRLFVEPGVAARRYLADAAPSQRLVELELRCRQCRSPHPSV